MIDYFYQCMTRCKHFLERFLTILKHVVNFVTIVSVIIKNCWNDKLGLSEPNVSVNNRSSILRLEFARQLLIVLCSLLLF